MQGAQIATATRRQLVVALTAVACLVGLILAPAHADAASLHHHAHKHLPRGSVAVVATVDIAGNYARADLAVTGQPKGTRAADPHTLTTTHAVVSDTGRAVITPQGRGPPRSAS